MATLDPEIVLGELDRPESSAPELRHTARSGIRIAYEIRGETGPFLVLVHGLGYGRSGWGAVADSLARHRRVVLVDNRGIGESDRPRGPYSTAQMAADIAAVLEELGHGPFEVLGASLGGMIVLELAQQRPELLSSMVLVATTPGEPVGVPLPASTVGLLRRDLAVSEPLRRRLIEGALSPRTVARRPEVVEELLRLRASYPQEAEAWTAQAAASAGFSLGCDLHTIVTPTLALAGLEDAVIDPRNTMILAFGLPFARAVLLSGAGHLCFWDQPGRVSRAVEGFLDSIEEAHGRDGATDSARTGPFIRAEARPAETLLSRLGPVQQ